MKQKHKKNPWKLDGLLLKRRFFLNKEVTFNFHLELQVH